MSRYDKEYAAFEIFEQIQKDEAPRPSVPAKRQEVFSFEEAPYYEIEYDTGGEGTQAEFWEEKCAEPERADYTGDLAEPARIPLPKEEPVRADYAGDSVEPARIPSPQADPVREVFNRMRDIAREDRYLNFRSSKFYDQRMRQENSKTFYRQGMFMKDFRDESDRTVPYSAYYPSYQMMGYDQLRTFFTWRTRVRQGRVEHVSLSYAFLYLYELLNNIGVDGPGEGLEQLLFFWDAFRVYDRSLDKYVVKWLKDYCIYYELPRSFREVVEENDLGAYYPELEQEEVSLELYCARSKYDIRKSAFFTQEREELVRRCFRYTFERLREALAEGGFELDDLLFQPTRNRVSWVPFRGALFYPAGRQRDRQVMLSRKEIYVCSGNQWTFSAVVATDSGKRLMGYLLKQMEAVLRNLTKYRHKLYANPDMLSPVTAEEFKKAGICLEEIVTEAVKAFYREETKTVVRVNPGALEKIRREAYVIQEKLIVPEEGSPGPGQAGTVTKPSYGERDGADGILDGKSSAKCRENITKPDIQSGAVQNTPQVRMADPGPKLPASVTQQSENDGWRALREALTEAELQALRIILDGETDLKQFADGQGILLEVLAEGINDKAADVVGDGLLDNGFEIYEDYLEDIRAMLEAPIYTADRQDLH